MDKAAELKADYYQALEGDKAEDENVRLIVAASFSLTHSLVLVYFLNVVFILMGFVILLGGRIQL